MSAAPVIDLADELDDEADPWDDDEDELAEDADADEAELVPPFAFVGLVDVPDPMPVRRRSGTLGQAPEWRDANGQTLGELDLYRWGQRVHEITPDGYATREEYLAAWDATEAETEAAKAHAWDTMHAAGVEYDDARRRYVQRPRAV